MGTKLLSEIDEQPLEEEKID
uniref:Uncharacterized protein n=1 Tax=Arundo donax TaxID=35708 RepID=A0A0A9AKV8_ARUDO